MLHLALSALLLLSPCVDEADSLASLVGQLPADCPIPPGLRDTWELHPSGDSLAHPIRPAVVAVMDENFDVPYTSIIGTFRLPIAGDPDLATCLFSNTKEIPEDGIDNDGNGHVDDFNGTLIRERRGASRVALGSGLALNHGTNVALDVCGPHAPAHEFAKVLPVNVNEYGGDPVDIFVEAVNYITQMKRAGVNIRVVNHSRSLPYDNDRVRAGLRALAAADILFVGVADNGRGTNMDDDRTVAPYADEPNVLFVTAADDQGALADYASRGPNTVSLAAYSEYGTSFAAPKVASVAAVIAAQTPSLDYRGLRQAVLDSTSRSAGLVGHVVGGRLLGDPPAPKRFATCAQRNLGL